MKIIQVFSSFPTKYQPYNTRFIDGICEAKNLKIEIISKVKTDFFPGKYQVEVIEKSRFETVIQKYSKNIFLYLANYNSLRQFSFKKQLKLVSKFYFVLQNKEAIFHFHNIQSLNNDVVEYMKNNKIKYVVSLRGYDVTILPITSESREKFVIAVLKNAWKIHSVCEDLKIRVVNRFGIEASKIQTIYRTPKLTSTFKAPIVEKLDTTINIFTISRIHWKKCLSESLMAIKTLINQGYKVAYHIIGGSEGNGQEFEKLNYLIIELGLKDVVYLHGYVSEENYPEFLKDMHIFWMPTLNEGIPNILYYILKCGFPVIASNVNGIPEVIEHGKNGMLFSNYDFVELYEKTKLIIDDDGLRVLIQKNAFYTELQTIEKEIANYISFYLE